MCSSSECCVGCRGRFWFRLLLTAPRLSARYIAKTEEYYGITKTRGIYEKAVEELSDGVVCGALLLMAAPPHCCLLLPGAPARPRRRRLTRCPGVAAAGQGHVHPVRCDRAETR